MNNRTVSPRKSLMPMNPSWLSVADTCATCTQQLRPGFVIRSNCLITNAKCAKKVSPSIEFPTSRSVAEYVYSDMNGGENTDRSTDSSGISANRSAESPSINFQRSPLSVFVVYVKVGS